MTTAMGELMRHVRWVTAGLWFALTLPTASLHAQTRVGEVALETPSAGTEPFGDITAVLITSHERAWVVDRLASRAYLLNTSRDLVTVRGREGDGPGEFRSPCCVTLAGDRLWVLSPDFRRIDVIAPKDGDDREAIRISLEPQVANSFMVHRPPVVLGEGRSVMVIANRHDSNADRRDYRRDRVVALEYDLTGAFLREWPGPSLPDRYVGYGVAEASYPTSRVKRMSLGLPFGPFHAVGRNSNGGYAAAFTRAYDVSVHGIGGELVTRIVRPDVEGPPLTPSEREERDEFVEFVRQGVKRAGGTLSIIGASDPKPPIDWIAFDAEDRLWVALTPHGDAEWAEADVYSSDGTFVFRGRWPANVDLSKGAHVGRRRLGSEEGRMGRGLVGVPQVWACGESLTKFGHLPIIHTQYGQRGFPP